METDSLLTEAACLNYGRSLFAAGHDRDTKKSDYSHTFVCFQFRVMLNFCRYLNEHILLRLL